MLNHRLRIALIVSLALLVFLGGSAISQEQNPADRGSVSPSVPSSYPVVVGQPPGTIVTSGGAYDIPDGTIAVTDLGPLPAVITVTVGAQVSWVNNTASTIQISGPSSAALLYLPVIVRPDGNLAAGADASTPDAHSLAASWTSDPIAPGAQFGRFFAEVGTYRYYVSNIDGVAGVVVVVGDILANTTWVEVDAGATIEVGTSTLEIPPGALDQDTTITVGEPISGTTMQADGMMMVRLEPSGLTFNRPATLTLSYGDTGTFDEEFLQVVAFNEQTGEWEQQEILAQDEQQNTVTVKTEHFSWRVFFIDEPIYLAMEIPGRFLKPGDILVRMQGYAPNCIGKAVWFPGHTGIYSATVGLEEQIIESNSYSDATDWNCGGWSGGVRNQTFAQFIDGTCGFYLGARRKAGASVAQQTAARDYVVERLGKGYWPVGEGNFQENCYSCVGLVEAGYDRAGASIIPTAEEFPFITPLGQFQKTIPVSEIDVVVGEQVRIPVKAIFKVVTPFGGDHYEIALLYPSATSLPTGSTYSGGIFNWTPQPGDDGKDFAVQFHAQATVGGAQYGATQLLTIHVQALDEPMPTPTPTPTPHGGIDTVEEILIPAGTFPMGCDRTRPTIIHCGADAEPLHSVYLDAYYVDKYEVSNARFKACVDDGGCDAPRSIDSQTRKPYYGTELYADYPVVNVTWYQAAEFCAWAGKRLPTEAEWEKAARGNSDARAYPWGDSRPDCTKLNYYEWVAVEWEYCVGDTNKIGSYPGGSSPWGVMDVAGNVKEWVYDWYSSTYYSVSPTDNPLGPATGYHRVLRGGSWKNNLGYVRVDVRTEYGPDDWYTNTGFRCVRSP